MVNLRLSSTLFSTYYGPGTVLGTGIQTWTGDHPQGDRAGHANSHSKTRCAARGWSNARGTKARTTNFTKVSGMAKKALQVRWCWEVHQAEKGQWVALPGRKHSIFKGKKVPKRMACLGNCGQLREAEYSRMEVGIKLEGCKEALYPGRLALEVILLTTGSYRIYKIIYT